VYTLLLSGSRSFLFFGDTGFWSHGFSLAKQALYHLSHNCNRFCFSYIFNRVSHFYPDHLQRQSTRLHLLYSGDASLHHVVLLVEIEILLTLCLFWPWTKILPMSSSQEAEITSVSHSTRADFSHFITRTFTFQLCCISFLFLYE
jgi:hypothetical protein